MVQRGLAGKCTMWGGSPERRRKGMKGPEHHQWMERMELLLTLQLAVSKGRCEVTLRKP